MENAKRTEAANGLRREIIKGLEPLTTVAQRKADFDGLLRAFETMDSDSAREAMARMIMGWLYDYRYLPIPGHNQLIAIAAAAAGKREAP